MRILVVEDNLSDLQTFERVLEEAGYEVVKTTKGEDALVFVRHNPIDGAVVDLTLKDATFGGMTFIRKCRIEGHYFPVLVVTAKPIDVAKEEVSRTIGRSPLDYADDYMEKRPGRRWLWEVRERLRNLITPMRMLVFPPYKFDRLEKRVYLNDAALDLPLRESRILERLMQHRGRVVTSHQLYDLIRDQDVTEDEVHEDAALTRQQQNLIHRYVGNLRRSLDPDGRVEPIQTVPNAGYRFQVPPENRPWITEDTERVIVNVYQLEVSTRTLVIRGENGEIVELQPLECRILEVLMRSAGVMRSRAWIHERVYGASDMTSLAELDECLLTLRKKTNRGADGPLRTLPDTGYYCFSGTDV